jgi:tetratricopeptide (TPR) repeat protein
VVALDLALIFYPRFHMTDAAARAEAAKTAGNAAFTAKNYDEAIKFFTEAIEADPTNHVLYSNRSGAYCAKADFKAALLDANECIKLNEQFAKGHSRRGAAYFGLKNWPQSQAAYERGLELDPNSAAMKAELEKVKLQRDPKARAAAEAAAATSASRATGAASRPPALVVRPQTRLPSQHRQHSAVSRW